MGRNREFDSVATLERILMMFWAYGSIDLSLDEISKRLGLSKTSLYSAYGSKDDLVINCLDYYYESYDLELLSHFNGSNLGTAVLNFLNYAEMRFSNTDLPAGCFMINCLIEKKRIPPAIKTHVEQLASLFFTQLEISIKNYKVGSVEVGNTLKKISLTLYGLAVSANFRS